LTRNKLDRYVGIVDFEPARQFSLRLGCTRFTTTMVENRALRSVSYDTVKKVKKKTNVGGIIFSNHPTEANLPLTTQTMKILSAASLTILLLNGATSQTCPSVDEYSTKSVEEDGEVKITFKYAIVLASSSDERSILCGRVESDLYGGWLGLGISPNLMMDSGMDMQNTGIIGLPDDGTVQKYWLANEPRVDLMGSERQTLMGTSIGEVNGTMVMEFTKYLDEDGEFEITPSGENGFIYALGEDATLAFHKFEGEFNLDFGMEASPPATADNATSVPPPAPESTPTSSSGITTIKVASSIVLGAYFYATWF
jgi:hypothetical protein